MARPLRRIPPALAVLALAASAPAFAQGVVSEKALSLGLAQAIAEGALEKCRADGSHVSITILDRGGLMKIVLRDEGSGPHTLTTSRRKAFTSLTFKAPSGEWAKRVLGDPAAAGLKDTAGTIPLGGGLPIKAGSEVIGAIGVSGSPGGDKDEACADAGIRKVAGQLN